MKNEIVAKELLKLARELTADTQFDASHFSVDREEEILIPGRVNEPGFIPVRVTLASGLSKMDVEDEDVVLLESRDSEKWRFERWDPAGEWDEQVRAAEQQGWNVLGFGAVRFYQSYRQYVKAEEM